MAFFAAPTAKWVCRPWYFQSVGILADVGDVPVADFGGDLRGEVAGVEQRGIAHARLAGQQPPPHGFDVGAQGRNAADARNHNASSHGSVPHLAHVGALHGRAVDGFERVATAASAGCRRRRDRRRTPPIDRIMRKNVSGSNKLLAWRIVEVGEDNLRLGVQHVAFVAGGA